MKLFFLQYVPYFLGNMILNWVVWRCFDALKIWDSLCFLLPTLRRNSCLFSQTLLIPNLVSVNQTIIHYSDCCRYDSFAMCHDKCNINFCTSLLIAANMEDRALTSVFDGAKYKAQCAELMWYLNLSLNSIKPGKCYWVKNIYQVLSNLHFCIEWTILGIYWLY